MPQEEKPTEHRLAMRELDFQIRSNRPLIYLVTHEERRVIDALSSICQRDDHHWNLLEWDVADGLSASTAGITLPAKTDLDPEKVLKFFEEIPKPESGKYLILVLKDYYKFMGKDGSGLVENKINRKLCNLSHKMIGQAKTIIIVGNYFYLPSELEKSAAVIDWPLPEPEHISSKVNTMLEYASKTTALKARGLKTDYSKEEMDEIVRSFQGTTLKQIEHLCTYNMLKQNELDPKIIASEKRSMIRSSGLLDWMDVDKDMNSVGGLTNLKNWLEKRRDSFSTEASDYGLPDNPKGLLLIGVQGSGKTASANAIAGFWNLPLLRLDMGKLFGEYVGRSESNIRSVIKLAESVSPSILMIDEIDKGMSGSSSSNQSDGGTTSRVLGSLLTWLQEKKKPVFVVATANNVSQLPPELLRKGRFDEIFFVDLPNDEEREEIFRIHLRKRDRDPGDFGITRLVEASVGYTGAEIEQSIIAAMYESFYDDKRDLTTIDILNSLKESVPLSITMKENIDSLRAWAKNRARNASEASPSESHNNTIEKPAIMNARRKFKN